ncbi:DUF4097 domain-containing protein [Streptomyces gamaensis]|uniref:DUF4097 domain-containing protein n=1 Tax=Streptomyces gamaensis TaxID=1763542 RepID=A0ABW0Z7N3_9ACTN
MPVQSHPSSWSLPAPQKIAFEEPVTAVAVRLVGGAVNVVGTDSAPAGLELTLIDGPPLTATLDGGVLTVTYDDLPWSWESLKKMGLPKGLRAKDWHRRAELTLTVPKAAGVDVSVVSASTVVSHVGGATRLRGVSGDSTLLGLTGEVNADTVSGRLEAQALAGDLRFKSVGGGLTLVESTGGAVHADSVSGDFVIGLAPTASAPDLDLTTVSGEIAIRLPRPADAEVDAGTTSGALSCTFDELRVSNQFMAKRVTGRLGAGRGRLKATTVSGSVALLRGPGPDETPDAPVALGKVL